jgi:tetratricopeptide (TPR) repeat protein
LKYLVGNAWDKFKRETEAGFSFNGDEFEELIRCLLDETFSGTWEKTPPTRDGGKDVVDRSIPGDIAWAECKMYKRPLSLYVVSNTLVMAFLEENVRRILFFSYSNMTDEAKKYLASFASRAKKEIQVFDGELLENIILRSRKTMDKYFSQVLPLNIVCNKNRNPEFTGFFSRDVSVRSQQLNLSEEKESSSAYKMPINTLCLYELILIAHHSDGQFAVNLQLSVKDFKDKHLEILNMDKVSSYEKVILNAGQALSIPVYFIPRASGNLILPPISIEGDGIAPVSLPAVSLSVTALNRRPVLVGKKVQEALLDSESFISCGRINRVFAVSGCSGTGKTRFLQEMTLQMLRSDYEVHEFDGHTYQNSMRKIIHKDGQVQHIAKFIRCLMCSFWHLPNPDSLERNSGINATSKENVSANMFGCVSDIIYCWNDACILDELDFVKSYLLKGFCGGRNALVIDNIQEFSEPLIHLLEDLMDAVVGMAGQSIMLLSFTEDRVVMNSAACSWLDSIKKMSGEHIRYNRLEDFSRSVAEQFFDNLFERSQGDGLFSETYPALLNKILEKIMLRPLDLWLFASGLDASDAICLKDDLFLIKDLDKFHSALNKLSPNREELLDWLLGHFSAVPNALLSIAAITYLGPLSWHEMKRLINNSDVCEKLMRTSILCENREQKVDFFHPSLAQHLMRDTKREKFIKDNIKNELYLCASEKLPAYKEYAQWFGLVFDVRNSNEDIDISASAAVIELTNQDVNGYSPLHLTADRLLSYIAEKTDPCSLWPLLRAFTGAAHVAALGAESILHARTDYLYSVARKIAPLCPPEVNLADWVRVIREGAGYLASVKGKSSDADLLLDKSLLTLKSMEVITARRAEAHLLNRRCVTSKNLGKHKEAHDYAEQSIIIANANSMTDLVCLNYVDLGYLSYGLQSQNDQLLHYWSDAITHFNNRDKSQDNEIPDIDIVILLIEGYTTSLKNDFKNSIKIFDALLQESERREHWYYRLQGMLGKGTVMMRNALMLPKEKETKTLLDQVLMLSNSLVDITMSMNQSKRYRSALYLQGKAYEALGQIEGARHCYSAAFNVHVEKNIDYEKEVILYDFKRIQGEFSGRPFATTFSVNDIYLPLP